VDLLPSADQLDMVEAIEQFLTRELSTTHLHERLRTGLRLDRTAWATAAELGIFSLGLPEEAGGAGCPVVEEALVFRALGRHLAPVGFLGSVIAARIAHLSGAKELRDAVTEGSQTVALALSARPGATHLDVLDLPGSAHLVYGQVGALVLAATDGRVAGERTDCLDPSTELTRVPVTEFPAAVDIPAADLAGIAQLGTLLTAAMLVGIAEAARDASVAYAKERVQFGRPIGVNQAIKHPCADMAAHSEAAASLLFFAALALRDDRPDTWFQVAAAKRIATMAAFENCRANVQVHGGMGVTFEHDAHLLLTRAHLLDQLFGDVHHQQQTMLHTAPSIP
jgi:alkylation response protein AidB-like acyl-CoA dehydrogenase